MANTITRLEEKVDGTKNEWTIWLEPHTPLESDRVLIVWFEHHLQERTISMNTHKHKVKEFVLIKAMSKNKRDHLAILSWNRTNDNQGKKTLI